MQVISGDEIHRLLDFPSLIDALRAMFRDGCEAPARHHHRVAAATAEGAPGTLLLMPAWQAGRGLGIKIVTVFPDNARRSLPAVYGTYLLLDAATGMPLALLDGTALTLRRTAAASALAAGLAEAGFAAEPVAELEEAASAADIITCATLAHLPLIRGSWLRPGTHLDLVGGYTPEMREADDAAIARARVYVDTNAALREAGDIVQPLRSGHLARERIAGDLFDLARGICPGRRGAGEITLFKSVGSALEDLAAAQLAVSRITKV